MSERCFFEQEQREINAGLEVVGDAFVEIARTTGLDDINPTLEVGAGESRFFNILAQRRVIDPSSHLWVPVDIEASFLKAGRTSSEYLHPAQANAVRLPFGEGMFHNCVALSFLDVLGPAGCLEACHEIARVLDRGGQLIVITDISPSRVIYDLEYSLILREAVKDAFFRQYGFRAFQDSGMGCDQKANIISEAVCDGIPVDVVDLFGGINDLLGRIDLRSAAAVTVREDLRCLFKGALLYPGWKARVDLYDDVLRVVEDILLTLMNVDNAKGHYNREDAEWANCERVDVQLYAMLLYENFQTIIYYLMLKEVLKTAGFTNIHDSLVDSTKVVPSSDANLAGDGQNVVMRYVGAHFEYSDPLVSERSVMQRYCARLMTAIKA